MVKNENFRSTSLVDVGYTDLVPLNCGFEVCSPGHTGYGMREYYMIHFVERGRGELTMEGKRYSIGEASIFIIPPKVNAFYVADRVEPWEYVWICFDGRMAEKLDEIIKSSPVQTADRTPFELLTRMLYRENTKEEVAVAALNMIFADLFSDSAEHPDYVDYTIHTVNTSYMQHITVEGIAKELAIDRRYLSRIFSAKMGISIKEYLTRVRLEKAKEHLRSGKSVALTAELVGYFDTFNFSKMFKKYEGVAPKKYSCPDK